VCATSDTEEVRVRVLYFQVFFLIFGRKFDEDTNPAFCVHPRRAERRAGYTRTVAVYICRDTDGGGNGEYYTYIHKAFLVD